MRTIAKLLPLFLLCGCTSYRYDITSPDGGALAVKKDQDLIVDADPAKLRFRQVESRCVLIIDNPTTEPITLDGSASTLVDPSGQSRQLATQLIAPGSYIKLILPPMIEANPRGPQLQLGLGVMVDAGDLRRPQYLVTGLSAQDDWDWPGEGSVRVILGFKTATGATRHEIVLRKTKI